MPVQTALFCSRSRLQQCPCFRYSSWSSMLYWLGRRREKLKEAHIRKTKIIGISWRVMESLGFWIRGLAFECLEILFLSPTLKIDPRDVVCNNECYWYRVLGQTALICSRSRLQQCPCFRYSSWSSMLYWLGRWREKLKEAHIRKTKIIGISWRVMESLGFWTRGLAFECLEILFLSTLKIDPRDVVSQSTGTDKFFQTSWVPFDRTVLSNPG